MNSRENKIKTAYASLAGREHQSKGIDCQDTVGAKKFEGGAVMALSDGAGSKKYAAESAALLVNKTLEYFDGATPQSLRDFDADDFLNKIDREFESKKLPERELGGTLIFIVIAGERFLVGHVGDGLVLRRNGNKFEYLSLPENGSAPNETYFIPSESEKIHLRLKSGFIADEFCVIVCSDGISGLIFDETTLQAANACNVLAGWAAESSEDHLSDILKDNIENVFANETYDDMSMGIICRFV